MYTATNLMRSARPSGIKFQRCSLTNVQQPCAFGSFVPVGALPNLTYPFFIAYAIPTRRAGLLEVKGAPSY
jgi:hypothetical protein